MKTFIFQAAGASGSGVVDPDIKMQDPGNFFLPSIVSESSQFLSGSASLGSGPNG